MENKYFRIYAKVGGQRQFKAMDIGRGIQVDNLIYASVYNDKINACMVAEYFELLNEHIEFQVREVK